MDAVTFRELSSVIGASSGACDPWSTFDSVSIDSRASSSGSVFWALQGDRADGHDFVEHAARNGAAAAVVSRDCSAEIPCLVVEDVKRALMDFAAWYRATLQATVVAVTGSVGKTTTRHMIRHVLDTRYSAWESPANFNNQLGVPLSLLGCHAADDFVILELGASRSGDIRELATLAVPEIGVITAIAEAHLATFGEVANVRETKAELLDCLPEFGLALLNGDDPEVRALSQRAGCETRTFGQAVGCDIRATHVDVRGRETWFRVSGQPYCVPLPGRHHLTAALAAVAVGREAGLLPAEIQDGLSTVCAVAGRCEVRCDGETVLIDDTYNASPRSVSAAIETLAGFAQHERRTLILGDMAELGDAAARFHEAAGEACGAASIDQVLAVGQFAENVCLAARRAGVPATQTFTSVETLCEALQSLTRAGDAILVKGSRSMAMERVVSAIADRLGEAVSPASVSGRWQP